MSDGDDLTDLHGERIATTEARLEGFYWVGARRMVARRRSPSVASGGGDRRQRAVGVHAAVEAGRMSDRLARGE